MGLFSSNNGPAPVEKPTRYASLATSAPTTVEEASKTNTYDYVIVGGGTAGSVLASRLSEDTKVSVLLLEAGVDCDVLETQAPITFNKLFKTGRDWNYETVPQSHVGGRELYWPRGKMLGGSSSMNAMMYHHASYSDYDEWEQKFGCEGWGYKGLQPWFRKSEQFTPNIARKPVEPEHRGSDGLWQIGHSHLTDIGGKGFISACEETGIPFSTDINTPKGTEGVCHMMTFIDKNGKRSSAATAYLSPSVRRRANLTIAIKALVTKVVFDKSGSVPKAIAVEVQSQKDGPKYYAAARKQVILCAGSVNTSQTLMLSGIGPTAELEKHQIPVLVGNDNVGAHLKDHFCTSGLLLKAKTGTTLDYLTSPVKALPSLARWLLTGGGPLSSNVAECAAFFRSVDEKLPGSAPLTKAENRPEFHGSLGIGPDLEVIGAPLAYIDHGFTPGPSGADTYSMVPIGLRPKSEGNVTLQSADPWSKALIDPKYWTDKDDNDRKVLLAGVRICIAIAQSDAFKEWLEPVTPNNDPGHIYWPYSADATQITDEQILGWMSKSSFTLYHPVCSARMGTKPENSVVDYKDLGVWGTANLTVCDASVFPEQISGHPCAAVIAIAEKTADILKRKAST